MWNRVLATAVMFGAIAATGSLAWSDEGEQPVRRLRNIC